MAQVDDRGIIRSRKFTAQVNSFSGLRWGSITPTDIDGLIDFANRAFILIETKFSDCQIPYGQKLAIERVTDNLELSGKKSMAIICRHDCTDGQDIDVANCPVSEIRIRGAWHQTRKSITTKEVIDWFLAKNGFSP